MKERIEMVFGPMDGEIAVVDRPTQHLMIPRPTHDIGVFYAGREVATKPRRYMHRYTLEPRWSRVLDDTVKAYVYKGIECNGEW